MKRKVLCVILIITMMACVLPISASADGGDVYVIYVVDVSRGQDLPEIFPEYSGNNATSFTFVFEAPDGTEVSCDMRYGGMYWADGEYHASFSSGHALNVAQAGRYTLKTYPVPSGYEVGESYSISYDGEFVSGGFVPRVFTHEDGFTHIYFDGDILISIRRSSPGTVPPVDTPDPPTTPDTPHTWAEPEVTAAIAAGLVPQELQRNYRNGITRGEMAQMFINLIEKASGQSIDDFMAAKGVAINDNAFTDTNDRAVLAANALGIIMGFGDGSFNPGGNFTRAHIAVMINRVARTLGVDTDGYTHSFIDMDGHWAEPELGWPVHAGIIEGVGDNMFDPEANLTTEMAIVLAYRALAPLSQ